jgi:hypothetical protein
MRIKTEKFYVLLTLFLFTGIALYLNERPFEPRARLCFSGIHVFAIWIGFGVYAFYAQKYLAPKVRVHNYCGEYISCPVLMASKTGMTTTVPESIPQQQWPKHTLIPAPLMPFYSQTTTRFHYGAQEIEHVRTDIKIVNTSLLWRIGISTRWKQKHMKRSHCRSLYTWSIRRRQIRLVHIPKQKADGDKDFMDFIKIQNLQLVCKMDRQFIFQRIKTGSCWQRCYYKK